MQVTWALGHLATLKEPHDYDPALKRWSLESLPFVPERFGLKLIEDRGNRKQFEVIRRLFRSADELVCATDAGREGELIFRYILDLAGCVTKPTQRLWLSFLTESAIREALRPSPPPVRLRRAIRGGTVPERSRLGRRPERHPLLHGALSDSGTPLERRQSPDTGPRDDRPARRRDSQLQTRTFLGSFDALPRSHVQIYRQPLLEGRGRPGSAGSCLGHPFTIQGVDRKPERVPPPQLYDLTDLQRDMNRRYGLSADATLKAAQALYEAKLVSYPRTDSRYLGTGHESEGPGDSVRPPRFEADRSWEARLESASLQRTNHQRPEGERPPRDHPDRQNPRRPRSGEPKGLRRDRHAIHRGILPALSQRGYNRLRGLEHRAVSGSGRTDRRPRVDGTLPRNQDDKKDEEQELPEFKVGESGPHDPTVKRGETTPPKSYTEGTLLGAMETAGKFVDDEELKEALKERGLGTPATRASIIETLLARGYITRDKKTLAATDLGRYLVALIQGPRPEESRTHGRVGGEASGDRTRAARRSNVHDRDRPLHRRGHSFRGRDGGRPEPARRLSALWAPGDRGQEGVWLLRLAGRMHVRALA